jgi:endogenous inhibitor of DNA gyrase (YacG/DUF329 family)
VDLGRWLNEEIRLPVSPEAAAAMELANDSEN